MATLRGRGPQVVLEGYARTVARGAAAGSMRANIAAMDALVIAGLVADGNAVDGSSRTGGQPYDVVVAQYPHETTTAWEIPAPLLDLSTSGGGGGSMAGVTKVDRSGTITLANTAQTLMPANASRHGWSLQNKSSANMWFNDLGSVADLAANNSTYIPPGAYYESEPGGASVAAISFIGDVTGAQFAAKEW